MYDLLFSKVKINKLELKNRVFMIPMHTLFAKDNMVTERDIEYIRCRAAGGPAAITISTAVAKRGSLYHQHHICDDSYIDGLKKLADVCHEYDCRFFVQLFHCGRCGNQQTLEGLKPMAPSNIPSRIYKEVPEIMTIDMIHEAEQQFIDAAVRAKKAGIDGVEVSVSVGYLICEFISTVTNDRTDEYGGSEENRFRFALNIFRGIRNACGSDYPIMMRLSASQMDAEGYDINCMIRFCKMLEAEGLIDMVSVTGGWHEAPLPLITYHVPQGGYAFLTDTIRREINTPVLYSTRINDGESAEEIIRDGVADFVGMGRPFLADPNIVSKIKEGKPFNKCQGCSRGCNEHTYVPTDITCVYNPELGKEYIDIKHPGKPENNKKHILVIGAGPAGLYAAVKAAKKGYKVTIATKDDQLGGALRIAALPPRKADLLYYVQNKEYELKELGVEILLNTDVDVDFIKQMKPDTVVIATGAEEFIPPIEGLKLGKNVHFAMDVLQADPSLISLLKRGKTIVLGGGSVGIETAQFLAEKGFGSKAGKEFYFNEVMPAQLPILYNFIDITVIEMGKKIASDLGSLRRFAISDAKQMHIKMLTETKLVKVGDDSVSVIGPDGEKELPYDNIIIASGRRPIHYEFMDYLESSGIDFVKLGDAVKLGSALNATEDAFNWSLTI